MGLLKRKLREDAQENSDNKTCPNQGAQRIFQLWRKPLDGADHATQTHEHLKSIERPEILMRATSQ